MHVTPDRVTYLGLAILALVVVILGVLSAYSFLPDRDSDGFLSQLQWIHDLIVSGQWETFIKNPLAGIYLARYLVVQPFLVAEQYVGSVGSLLLLYALLCPLVLAFQPKTDGLWFWVLMASRAVVLLLPLAVSGRTVLVVAGMGYLVSGIMQRPFSLLRMLFGGMLAVLSSASLVFSIAVLVVAGNWRDRSTRFYVTKIAMVVILSVAFLPSLLEKAEGFASGAEGYQVEMYQKEELPVEVTVSSDMVTESGPIAAAERILMRSTVVQSYIHGNYARLALYLGMVAAAFAFILWALVRRRRHPLLLVLAGLSLGILLEGLALWPIFLPLVWAYTGSSSFETGGALDHWRGSLSTTTHHE